MPFDPKDFLTIAKKLLNDPNYANESAYRTCVSRAYYATFLVCKIFLEVRHGFYFPETADAHRLVVRRLRQRRVIFSLGVSYGAGHVIADALKDLRRNGRNESDYKTGILVTQSDAQNWIRQAEYVINKIP